MGVLLMLVGLLTSASGLLKLRGGVRSTVGSSKLAVCEVLIGAIALAGSGAGLASVRPVAWLIVGLALVLLFTSTWTHGKRMSRYVREREETEALRLQTYIFSKEGT